MDRLQTVQRRFECVADLGSPRFDATRAIATLLPAAILTRIAPTGEGVGSGPWLGAVGDEERLPIREGTLDLAVSVLGLHVVNDLPGTLTQIRRALKPDGLFLGALLGGQTLQELRAVLAEAEAEIFGGASPRVAPFSDLRDLGALLQRAGFALPVTDLDRVIVRYPNLFGLFRDLRAMGATNALADRSRTPVGRRLFLRAAELYAARFADADGRLRATFEIVWLSGWSPHESQQKPLKPGSARMRLADALGVKEQGSS